MFTYCRHNQSAPYTLETLIFYIFAEHSVKGNTEAGIYIIVSVLVQTALQMGYHRLVLSVVQAIQTLIYSPDSSRDLSHYSELSPLAGELHRRAWCFIVQIDALSPSK